MKNVLKFNVIDRYRSMPAQVKASIWFLIAAVMQRGISVLTTPIFTRILTTEEYGQFSVFNSWLGIVTVIVTLNLFSGVFSQGIVKFEEERDLFASSLLGLTTTLVLGWTIVYLIFRDFWNNLFSLTTPQVFLMLVMIWSSSIFSFWSMMERVDYKYRDLVIITLLVSILKPVLGIVLVKISTDKVTARIFGLAIVELFAYSWMFLLKIKKGKKLYSKRFWLYALKFNFPLIPHYLSTTILNSADRIMIGKMVNESAAGIYNLAYSVSILMTIFCTALIQTYEPWLYKKIKKGELDSIAKATYPAFLCIALLNILLILFAPEIVYLFAPVDYYDAIWVIPPIAMSVLFIFAYVFFAVFEFYYEKTHYIAIATFSGALLNIFLNYIFINLFGYYAAGYTTLVCYIVYTIAHFCFMKSILKETGCNTEVYNVKTLLAGMIIFICVGFACLFTYNYSLIRYIIIVVLFVVLCVNHKKVTKYIKGLLEIRKEK